MAKHTDTEGDSLFPSEAVKTTDPVECLGLTFPNDEERRKHFLGLLCAGLQELQEKLSVPFTSLEDTYNRLKSLEHWPLDTEEQTHDLAQRMARAASSNRGSGTPAPRDLLGLYKDEVGFPLGSDEDILALSDPPYYTACPNPFIPDMLSHWQSTKDTKGHEQESSLGASSCDFVDKPYHREPFAADVSEGKNDPIYNAHSYHTKVPHKAIMRYILHYTEPGDVVFDGFCGTGMTGVAAQLCGDRATVESLGYRVEKDGTIFQQETDENGKTIWKPISKLGARRAVLNNLSPAATFIAYNYNTPVDVVAFKREAKRILEEVEAECGWMYRTFHASTKDTKAHEEEIRKVVVGETSCPSWITLGTINYTVWSDVFVCPECTREVVFWEAAVDKSAGKVHDEFPCPHCGARLSKRTMQRAWVTRYDRAIQKTIRQAKQVPVLINYSTGKERFEKTPDAFDLALIAKIDELDIPYWFPTDRMPEGYNTEQPKVSHSITHVHHFYTKRNLWVLGALSSKCLKYFPLLSIWLTSSLIRTTKMYKFTIDRKMGNVMGTLYVPSLWTENSTFKLLHHKLNDCSAITLAIFSQITSCASASDISMHSRTIDYIFTDPPFGGNLMYSELNFLWESWLKVFTNNKPEAIENKVQGKGLAEYKRLMTECFREFYRVLKPGRWMTVEFHNSKNSVWNAIQEALQAVGFVIADVRTLDKQQGSFKQVTSASAVKQDLIISCYKPTSELEERFQLEAGTEEGVWDFVRSHLRQLPVFVSKNGQVEVIAVRQNFLLYDRMVAFHVQRGVMVPVSAADFYAGLARRFPERDGMYFLPEQAAEYDRKRLTAREVLQLQLFVTDS